VTLTIVRRSPGNNFQSGREDPFGKVWDPDQIVIHVTEGNRDSVRSWFANDDSDVSAHDQICTDGSVDEFLDGKDTAWHAGRVQGPTAPLVLERTDRRTRSGYVNPNFYSIGIEHEGTGTKDLTPKQFVSSVERIRYHAKRWRIPITRRHIVGHHEVYSAKTCPGAINVDALVLAAASPTGIAARPIVVWSKALGDWLIVTRINADDDWYFVPMKAVRSIMPVRAGARLSAMPMTAD
jgi:hypothetical protein